MIAATYARYSAERPDVAACPLCDGLGIFSADVPVGHTLFGRALKCPCGAGERATAQERIERLFGEGGIPDSHQGYTFDVWTVMTEGDLRGKSDALKACRYLVEHGAIPTRSGAVKCGIVLAGEPGVGKSSLAAATAMAFAASGKAVLFSDFNDLIEDVQASYGKAYNGPAREKLIRGAAKAEVLVLDDMGGVEAGDDMTSDKRNITYAIIRERYHRSLLTVITTNLAADGFKRQFGKRINRRVQERFLWQDMTGVDLSHY